MKDAAPDRAHASAPLAAIVVGGGPVGLTTALLLARAGCAVTVLDARAAADARHDRRLLALSRGTWQTLAPWLRDALSVGTIRDVYVTSAGEFGRTWLSADDDDGTAPLGVTAWYGELLLALDAAAARVPAIRCLRPARVARVEEVAGTKDEHVSVTLDDGSALRADLVVHAEGAPDEADAAGPAAWALLAEVRLAPARPGAAHERFTREGPLALLPLPGSRGDAYSLVWCMGETAAAQRDALDDAAFVAQLQAALGPRIGRVAQAGPRRRVQLRQQRRAQIHAGRTVWLGNAAQTLHPVAGQGFNLGVRDALTLVEALLAVRPLAPATVPMALARYAQQRRIDRSAIGALTRRLPDVFATRFAPIAAARSLGLAALDLLPALRRPWARLLMFGVRE